MNTPVDPISFAQGLTASGDVKNILNFYGVWGGGIYMVWVCV